MVFGWCLLLATSCTVNVLGQSSTLLTSYELSHMTSGLHDITHVTFDFKALDPEKTTGAGLDFASWPYQQTLIFVAGTGALGLILSLSTTLVAFCCCACAGKHSRTQSWHRSTICLRMTLGVHAVMLLAISAAVIAANIHAYLALRDATDAVDSAWSLFDSSQQSLASAGVKANNTQDLVGKLQAATAGDESAPSESMQRLNATLEGFAAAVVDAQNDLPSLSDEHSITDDVKWYSVYFFAGYNSVAALVLIIAGVQLFSVSLAGRTRLGVSAAFDMLLLVLCWVITAVLFLATLAASDFCSQPTDFLNAQIHNTVLQFYLGCTEATDNPLKVEFQGLGVSLQAAQNDTAEILQYTSKHANVTALGGEIQRFVFSLSNTTTALELNLQCQGATNTYINALNGLCNEFVPWEVIALGLTGLAAIYITLQIVFISRVWHRMAGYHPAANGPDDEETTPLLFTNDIQQPSGQQQRAADRPAWAELPPREPAPPEQPPPPYTASSSRCPVCDVRPVVVMGDPCGHACCLHCLNETECVVCHNEVRTVLLLD